MSNYSRRSGREGSRRAGRRQQRGQDRSSRGPRGEARASGRKKSIWRKVLDFLTGNAESPRETKELGRESRREEESSARPARQRPQARKPEAVEVTSPRLYVGNLSFDATESDLFDLFNGVGTVQNVEVVSNRHTMRSKGFAFVQMQTIEEAKRAVEELHDKEYMGRKLVVSGAKALEERRPDGEPSQQQAEL